MRSVLLVLLLCRVSSVKHTLKVFYSASAGIPAVPRFMASLLVDDVTGGYCDDSKMEAKQKAWETVFDDDPGLRKLGSEECFQNQPKLFNASLSYLMQLFNQTGGVHVIQIMSGCEWDNSTKEVSAFLKYHYDGDDLISLDLQTLTWTPLRLEAVPLKQVWDSETAAIKAVENLLTQTYPDWLKKYLKYENGSLLRTVPPSVSLLQKSPFSPVSCHATGFYPNRAQMFWRKDGEEIHEDVDQGEILPNHDGTFQMRVDLDVSSVKDEDWSRYDCVLQLSGVEDDIITKLDKAVIRTNKDVSTSAVLAPVIFVIVVVLLLLVVAIAVILEARQKRKNRFRPANKPATEMLTDYGDRFVYLENSSTHEATRTTTTTKKKKKRLRFKF